MNNSYYTQRTGPAIVQATLYEIETMCVKGVGDSSVQLINTNSLTSHLSMSSLPLLVLGCFSSQAISPCIQYPSHLSVSTVTVVK